MAVSSDDMDKVFATQFAIHFLCIFRESNNPPFRHSSITDIVLKHHAIRNILDEVNANKAGGSGGNPPLVYKSHINYFIQIMDCRLQHCSRRK